MVTDRDGVPLVKGNKLIVSLLGTRGLICFGWNNCKVQIFLKQTLEFLPGGVGGEGVGGGELLPGKLGAGVW